MRIAIGALYVVAASVPGETQVSKRNRHILSMVRGLRGRTGAGGGARSCFYASCVARGSWDVGFLEDSARGKLRRLSSASLQRPAASMYCPIRLFPQSVGSGPQQPIIIGVGHSYYRTGLPPRPAAYRVRPMPLTSTLDGPAAGVSDPDPLDLDRRAVRFERLRHYRCEAGDHKPRQHVARELVGEYKQFRSDATRTAGE